MNSQTEVELKFSVPKDARAAVIAEVTRGSHERRSLAAMYLDTEDRRLVRAGMAWRLRREGRRWIQTLKGNGPGALERFEHEVIRPDASHDAGAHAGTTLGERLIKVIRDAREDGVDLGVRFQTEVRRTARKVRTRGAVVEVAFDEGRLVAGKASLRISEVEFELISGSATAMLGVAERWRKRFGLLYDPRSKSERGSLLADGSAFPPVRKAAALDYPQDAAAITAFCAVVDECLAHISRNAIGLVAGDAALHGEHVHQLRVGIRRLRSALRSFEGWVPPPPDALVSGVRDLFARLGEARDSEVLGKGVVAELAKAGAPALAMPAVKGGPDPAEAVRATGTQRLLLDWLVWRTALAEGLVDAPGSASGAARLVDDAVKEVASEPEPVAGKMPVSALADREEKPGVIEALADKTAAAGAGVVEDGTGRKGEDQAVAFRHHVERRLRRWHRRIAADLKRFDELDEESLHSLRKRIKRQRYAVEFFSPVLRDRKVNRYLKPLTTIQDRMGELNDLFVARAHYQNLVESEPAAWFALGWLAGRIADLRALAKPELKRLVQVDPPVH